MTTTMLPAASLVPGGRPSPSVHPAPPAGTAAAPPRRHLLRSLPPAARAAAVAGAIAVPLAVTGWAVLLLP